ncbi:MAG: RNA 3'-terminal phosphate cyclase [Candidatus Heimdallarchaeota archaeon]|nr:RNA 3'-terminal phosphate cyclase [Candidatus Heimdallarchaeota archaeon]MCK5048522.1 RNA 3'-terminal phosphate cyclase [Candidatus Heimdallarchaeota archaeon]
MIEIDGSIGGGSVIRLGAPLAILTDQKTRIINIRANRPKPGLSTQHMQGLKALIALTGSSIENVHLWSDEITITPSLSLNPVINIPIQTAGSVGLVFQIIQNASINSSKEINLHVEGGATYGKWAPPVAYLKNVTYEILKKIGLNAQVEVKKEGFFPKGGAKAQLTLFPRVKSAPLELLPLEKGEWDLNGEIIVSTELVERQVGERVKKTITKLASKTNLSLKKLEIRVVESLGVGCGVSLWANIGGQRLPIIGSGLPGERGMSSEKLGKLSFKLVKKEISAGSPIDEYALDQILLPLAIDGDFEIYTRFVSDHMLTNISVIERFLGPSFKLEDDFKTKLVRITPHW